MDRHRIHVPPDRLVVEYDVDPRKTMELWNDAATLRLEGWRMLSVDCHVRAYERSWFRYAASPAALRYTVLYETVDPEPAA